MSMSDEIGELIEPGINSTWEVKMEPKGLDTSS